ncbi:putative phosphatidylglycerol/phosphatidylinositol transfer protein 2 [Saccostrea echinata]|uniref:putative phosphatidylglycerol/phosphatidylinositol transfer protein 2 n=1 Tax=Saccostrea echinata TaxID=191078 RepID=UPI002A80E86F|nr:putative phosphatidylglycerol/phosphatidylinositol transfer protein 2 [Saccostrea echinata]
MNLKGICQRRTVKMMNVRKVPLIIALTIMTLFCSMFTLYMTMFNHGPPSEIMEANRRVVLKPQNSIELDSEEIDEEESEAVRSAKHWQKFVDDNKFVGIGDVYNSCDDKDRITIGKAIMLPDEETGGIKVRTFINITLEKPLTEGEFLVDVKYNGKDLYDNHWEFCTIDENQEVRQVFCPYKPGFYSWATDKKIPKFIPKGKYETRAWLNGDDGKLLTCGLTTFVL